MKLDPARAALDLAVNGWHVFPCRWQGEHAKAPLTAHGHHDATTDPAIISSWWQRWPDAMIGARVDPRLVVLDVDPRNGGEFDALRPEPTLTVWSGRGDGGAHLYYQRPAGLLTSRRLPVGVDLKVNGYCIAPPSLHPATGRPYTWHAAPIAPLPRHLYRLLHVEPSPPRPMVRRGDGKGLVAFLAGQMEGNRNNALFWAACRAAEDGTLEEIADELVSTAVAIGIPERSARAQLDSARNRQGVPA